MPCTLTVLCRAIFLNRLCGDESSLTRCINPICLKGVVLRHRFDLARCVDGHHPVAFIENVQHASRIFKTQGNGAIERFISVGAAAPTPWLLQRTRFHLCHETWLQTTRPGDAAC